jgi:hypothetical protein
VEEAIRLSEEKYCSVGAMVKKSAELHTTFEILPENDRETESGQVVAAGKTL